LSRSGGWTFTLDIRFHLLLLDRRLAIGIHGFAFFIDKGHSTNADDSVANTGQIKALI
jgi:hypothetical protein